MGRDQGKQNKSRIVFRAYSQSDKQAVEQIMPEFWLPGEDESGHEE